MRLVVIFEDTVAMTEVRRRLEPAHLEFLRANAGEIVSAGSLRETESAQPMGGLWVLEVSSRQRAIELVEADPYYQAERRPFRLLTWGKALA